MKENETMHEFNQIFNKVLESIPNEVSPTKTTTIMLHYLHVFNVNFGFMLKEKGPNTLKKSQDKAKNMEKNVSTSSKVNFLGASTSRSLTKSEPKLMGSNINEHEKDHMASLASSMFKLMKSKSTIMKFMK
jgi:hypothetical protein